MGHARCLANGRRSRGKQAPVFTAKTRFLLTESGIALARTSSSDATVAQAEIPHWDGVRTLWFAGLVVKHVERSAELAITLVEAFEKQHWKQSIVTPYTWHCETDQHKRLLNVVYHVNHHQENNLIRFHVRGGGAHIWWEDLRPKS
jgi:hypothetical protein